VTATARRPVRRQGRSALVVAGVLGLVLAGLIAVLATREPADLKISKSPLVGKHAPAISGEQLVGGGTFDLADDEGKFVLVNFFATWCVPCQKEHPELVRFANAHAQKGDAAVVSVVFGDEPDLVRAFFEQRGGNWPVVADDKGVTVTSWGVSGVPESYLVAPDGTVLGKITGGISSADDLDRLLARYQ
jgi:cytochrome c biogenesis protein CcmG/thiol:disulfide interchange protein DsbE